MGFTLRQRRWGTCDGDNNSHKRRRRRLRFQAAHHNWRAVVMARHRPAPFIADIGAVRAFKINDLLIIGDAYEAVTARLTPEQEGLYIRLFRLILDMPGGIPNDPKWITSNIRACRRRGEYVRGRVQEHARLRSSAVIRELRKELRPLQAFECLLLDREAHLRLPCDPRARELRLTNESVRPNLAICRVEHAGRANLRWTSR